MTNMNAFRGIYAASLAFKKELVQLAPGNFLGDLHRHVYMTGQDLIRDAGTAYQEGLAGEEDTAEDIELARQKKLLMRSFGDLSITKDMIHGTKSSFESPCRKWLSSAQMLHPAFGYFKFVYSPLKQVDYESCFRGENVLSDVATTNTKYYPTASSSWLYALPEAFTGDDSDTETIGGTEDQVIDDDENDEDDRSNEVGEAADDFHQPCFAALSSSAATKPFVSMAYIPPHKRGSHDISHSRSQSDSAASSAKASLPGRGSQRAQSEDSLRWQRTSNYKAAGQGSKAVRDLADNLNCSVFVSHLPEDVEYKELFAVITTGSVVSAHINKPIPGRPFCAAKITFKYPEGAARFIAQVSSPMGIQIRDHHLAAVYNDYGMVKHDQEHQSRVIHIHGPYKLMTENFWRKYFGKITRYQLVHVGYLPFNPNNKVTRSMEFHFARIEAQAQSILIAIIHDPQFEGEMICKYGRDPCGKDWETLPPRLGPLDGLVVL
ncbi:hypothetical protein BPOR_1272g00010 [Botrytis porri]|uniref:RRM domain-containing protein n=1 Tax=Botrytis porri TaxID=87229 RepID=A0A4Z1K6C8_9HELO|nr:hypothetical protein BPOR_1272g00010 [Botrytis porri]